MPPRRIVTGTPKNTGGRRISLSGTSAKPVRLPLNSDLSALFDRLQSAYRRVQVQSIADEAIDVITQETADRAREDAEQSALESRMLGKTFTQPPPPQQTEDKGRMLSFLEQITPGDLPKTPYGIQPGDDGVLGFLKQYGKEALRSVGFYQEEVVEPSAAVLTEAVQRTPLFPGEQEIEAQTAYYRAQGEGPVAARHHAYEDAKLPSVDFSRLSLPLLPNYTDLGYEMPEVRVSVKDVAEFVADPTILAGVGFGPKFLKEGLFALGRRRLTRLELIEAGRIDRAINDIVKQADAISPEALEEVANEAINAARLPPTDAADILQTVSSPAPVHDPRQLTLPGFENKVIPTAKVMRTLRDTAVVDEVGLPRVVYHGTKQVFKQFDPYKANPDALYGPGIYVTQNPIVASGYAGKKTGSNVTPMFVRIKKPWVIDGPINAELLEEAKRLEKPPVYTFETKPPMVGHRRLKTPKTVDEADTQIDQVEDLKGDLDARLDEMDNPDTKAGIELQDRITAADSYLDELNRFKDTLDDISEELRLDAIDAGFDAIVSTRSITSVADIRTNEELYQFFAGMESSAFGQITSEGKEGVQELLHSIGFDGITHIGGLRTKTPPHRVWIVFPEQRFVPDGDLLIDDFSNQIFPVLQNRRIRPKLVEPTADPDIGPFVSPLPPDVPAAQFALPGFRSGQTDLLEGRMQSLIDSGEATDFYDAITKAIHGQGSDAGLPPGKPPGPLAAHYGAAGDDSTGALAEMINAVPGEDLGIATLRKFDGARQIGATETLADWRAGQDLLRSVGVGVRAAVGKQNVTRPEMESLFKALHKEGPVPDNMRALFEDLKAKVAVEQADMLADDPSMKTSFMQHPNYFFRGWRAPKSTAIGRGRVGAKPAFFKPRNDATFTEMLDEGWEPISWNPYDMLALRRIAGLEYRQSKLLIGRLTKTGEARVAAEAPDSWRVPNIGPAFTGRPYVDAAGELQMTPRIAVSPRIANVLENSFNKADIGKPLEAIRTFGQGAKKMKLFASYFQDVDFATRAGGISLSLTGITKGAPIKYPSLIARLMRVRLSSAARHDLEAKILSRKPLYKDSDISLRMVGEEGWQLAGDTSMIRRSTMDLMERSILGAPEGLASKVTERVRGMQRFMEDGLFDGVYRETQAFALENFIIPRIRRTHPSWTSRQVAGSAAQEVNKIFSTLGDWQTIFSHPNTQAFTDAMMFSRNESEGWIRSWISAFLGPNKRLFQEYGLGLLTFLGLTANVINFSATGKPLPLEAYLPIKTGDPYAFLPHGVSYNNRFLSPQLPFGGRGGVPLYLDLVGQSDTVLRWILDPPGALTSRFNVLPRMAINQVKGESFYGRPIEGLRERVLQAIDDLYAPIGLGNLTDVVREQIPATAGTIPAREDRLGTKGSIFQMSGIGVKAETTPDLLNRAAQESGFTTKDGVPIQFWRELEEFQKRDLEGRDLLATELARRTLRNVERQVPGADTRQHLEALEQGRLDKEFALQSEFDQGIIDGEELRNRFGDIQSETAKARQERFKDFDDFLESGELPEDPNDAALVQFYAASDRATTNSGRFDFDIWQAEIADLERVWTREQKAFVDRRSGLTKHPVLFQELHEGRERWAPYWRVHRIILQNNKDKIRIYEDLMSVFGEPRKELEADYPDLFEAARLAAAARLLLRQTNPELDAFLYRYAYGGKTLAHHENQGREIELSPYQRNLQIGLRGRVTRERALAPR
jgi:hypothetical protein